MRWYHKNSGQIFCEGDTREEEKFLIFPKRINNETRWLEKAKYIQKYERIRDMNGITWLQWEDYSWLSN